MVSVLSRDMFAAPPLSSASHIHIASWMPSRYCEGLGKGGKRKDVLSTIHMKT